MPPCPIRECNEGESQLLAAIDLLGDYVSSAEVVCSLCSSVNEAEFTSEMTIHFSDLKHVTNSGVLAFPKISICMDCGASRFITPDTELQALREKVTGAA
jgi:hypothetical protein